MKKRHALSLALGLLLCVNAGALAKSHSAKGSVDPAEDNLRQGRLMIRKGSYESAVDSFKQAIYFSRNQYNPEAYKLLALSYKALRDYGHSVEAFTKFFSQTTERNPDQRAELAEVYMAQEEWDKARTELSNSSHEDVDGKEFWRYKYTKGELEEKMKDAGKDGSYSTAVEFYNEAIEKKPHWTDAWMAKARCFVKMQDYNYALEMYREILSKGVNLRPDLTELYYNMGTCLLKRGDHQGALDHWHMALEHNPDSYDAHLALAGLLDREKHFNSAIKEYRDAVRCGPKDNPAEQQILRRVQWLEQQSQPKEAPVEIKPSPTMRQQQLEEQQLREQMSAPPGKRGESGF